ESVTYNDGGSTQTFPVNYSLTGKTQVYLSDILGGTASKLNGHAGLTVHWTFTLSGISSAYSSAITFTPVAYINKAICESTIGTPVTFGLTFANLVAVSLTPDPVQIMCNKVGFNFNITYPAITNIDNGTGAIKNNAKMTSNVALPASTLTWSYNGVPGAPYTVTAGTTQIFLSAVTGITAPLQGHGGLADQWVFTLTGATGTNLASGDYTFTIENMAQLTTNYIYNTSTTHLKGLPTVTLSPISDISTITKTPVVIAETVTYPSPISALDAVLTDANITSTVAFPTGAKVESVTYNDGGGLISFPVNYSLTGKTHVYLSQILNLPASPLNGHAGLTVNWTFTLSGINSAYSSEITFTPVAYVDSSICKSAIGAPVTFDLTFADLVSVSLTPALAQIICDQVNLAFDITYPAITNIDNGTGTIKNNARITSDIALPASILNWSYNGTPGAPYTVTDGTTQIFLSDVTGMTAPLQGHGGLMDQWTFTLSGSDLANHDYTFTIDNMAQLTTNYIYNTSTTEIKGLPVVTLSPIADIATITHTPVIISEAVTYPATISALNTVLTDAYFSTSIAFPTGAKIESIKYDDGTNIFTYPVNFTGFNGTLTSFYLSDFLGVTASPLNGHEGLTVNWTFTISGFDAPYTGSVTIIPIAYINKGSCASVIGDPESFGLTFADLISVAVTPDPSQIMCNKVDFNFDISYPAVTNIDNGTGAIRNNAKIISDVALPASILTWSYNGVPGNPYTVSAGTTQIFLSDVTGMTAPLQGHGGLADQWAFTLTGAIGTNLASSDYTFTIENMAQLTTNYIYNTSTTHLKGLPAVTLSPISNISTITNTPVVIAETVTYPSPISALDAVLTDANITSTVAFPAGAVVESVTYSDGGGTLTFPVNYSLNGKTQVYLSDILGVTASKLNSHAGLTVHWTFTLSGISSIYSSNITFTPVAYINKAICESAIGIPVTFGLTFANLVAVSLTPDPVQIMCNAVGFDFNITYPAITNIDNGTGMIKNNAKITSNVALPASTLAWSYNGVPGTPYTVTAGTTQIFLSAVTGMTAPLQGHGGLADHWAFTITGATGTNLASSDYTFTVENMAQLITNYIYNTSTTHLKGLPTVTLSPISDISTITKTPVIISETVTYPATISAIGTVLTDAKITTDLITLFPAGLKVFKVVYTDGANPPYEIPISPAFDLEGMSQVYLSEILGNPSGTPLAPHAGKVINWQIFTEGATDPYTGTVTITPVAYITKGVCESVIGVPEPFVLTFADASMAINETDITVCSPDPLLFGVDITYPLINNVSPQIEADALLTSDIDFPSGTVIKWSYEGSPLQTYTLPAATSSLFLSQITGITPLPSLQGHSGTDHWVFEVTNAGVPSVHTLTIKPVAILGVKVYPYATDEVILTVNATPSAPGVTGATVCNGSTAVLSASGAVAGDLYKWYNASSGGTLLKTSSGNTDNTYTTVALSITTDYWTSIISALGCEGPRTKVTATVNGNLSAGAIAGDQTICSQGDPVAFTSTTPGTGDGTISYLWEKAVSPFSSWSVISGATNATYDPPSGLTATTRYHRITKSSLNGTDCYSPATAPVTVTVNQRHKISGVFTYYNLINTPLKDVKVKLYPTGNYSVAIATDTTNDLGYYEFPDLCPGTYDIVARSDRETTDAVNVTDAAQVNYWPTSLYTIEKVRFFAGDVTNDNYLNATDAQRIQKNFVYGMDFDRDKWTFWDVGKTINTNYPSPEPFPIITLAAGSDKTVNMYGLATGDFNRSFIPGAKNMASSTVNLIYNSSRQVSSNQEFDLPVRMVNPSGVGAVSLILNFPSDLVEVKDVMMNSINGQLNWAVNGNELRIGWNSLVPVTLAALDNLITLRMKTTSAFVKGSSVRISLAPNLLNELANDHYEVIGNAILGVDVMEASPNGIADQSAAEGIKLRNYPNPFANFTTLDYTLPYNGNVMLEIRNSLGVMMSVLVNELQERGKHTLNFDAGNLAQGVYTASIRLTGKSDDLFKTIKIVIHR
ncbi:MAG: hypothetical protein WCK09_07810, partial [Bacteroidota bacterium]